jgi:UMF1 family MFS transporter
MSPPTTPPVTRREIFAWAMFDFANSGYTTVVLTTIFNAYFVGVVAAGHGTGPATLIWSAAIAVANLLVLLSAPLVGAIADESASKKRLLAVSTLGCVAGTALLGFAGPGEVTWAVTWVIVATLMFSTGENLIAAFLPEIARPEEMGRISALGWTLGYFGGLLVLGLSLLIVKAGEARGASVSAYIGQVMFLTALAFAAASLPTYIWLRERARPRGRETVSQIAAGAFARLRQTLTHVRAHRDLFRFLITIAVYQSGVYTVIVLAAVFAQQVMGFRTQDTIVMVLVVNIAAALGAFVFGHVQDRIGSVRALAITLLIWIAALGVAYGGESRQVFWIAAGLIGLAMGASQSAGRALVGLFTPRERCAEYFGLWGLATKLAAIVGPLSYGLIAYLTGGDHRRALLGTAMFFIAGLALLATVDEARGRAAARAA